MRVLSPRCSTVMYSRPPHPRGLAPTITLSACTTTASLTKAPLEPVLSVVLEPACAEGCALTAGASSSAVESVVFATGIALAIVTCNGGWARMGDASDWMKLQSTTACKPKEMTHEMAKGGLFWLCDEETMPNYFIHQASNWKTK